MLAVIVADTPAAQKLGGFKERVGLTVSPCRTCDINGNLQLLVADQTQLRDELEHCDHVTQLGQISDEAPKILQQTVGCKWCQCLGRHSLF